LRGPSVRAMSPGTCPGRALSRSAPLGGAFRPPRRGCFLNVVPFHQGKFPFGFFHLLALSPTRSRKNVSGVPCGQVGPAASQNKNTLSGSAGVSMAPHAVRWHPEIYSPIGSLTWVIREGCSPPQYRPLSHSPSFSFEKRIPAKPQPPFFVYDSLFYPLSFRPPKNFGGAISGHPRTRFGQFFWLSLGGGNNLPPPLIRVANFGG